MSKIVCLGRQFGSGGHNIAEKVAKKMGIHYYDKFLLNQAVERSGLPHHIMENAEERKAPFMYEVYYEGNIKDLYGKPANDIMYDVQKQLILEAADEGDCIIVGRCAADILRQSTEHTILHVFISAPMAYRTKRVMQREGLDEKRAAAKIRKMDKARRAYYDYYTGGDWGKPSDYDMVLNPGIFGEDYMVNMVIDAMKNMPDSI